MEENPCIRIGHLKIVDHLILGIASQHVQNNKIRLNHSTLEPVPMNSWNQVCDNLINKKIDGAFLTVPIAMDLLGKGLNIKVLMFTHRSGSIIVKKNSPDIKNIKDFKGKTILVPSELSIQNMLLHRLLSTAGLTFGSHDDKKADVNREVTNPFLMTEMLNSDPDNDIAGFAVAEPFGIDATKNKIATKVCTSDSLWKDHPCCMFISTDQFIDNNHQVIQEIIDVFVQSGKFIEENKNKAVPAMAEVFLDKDKETIQYMMEKTIMNFHPELLIPDIEALETIQNYMFDTMGVLETKIDINQLVEASYIKKAVAGIKKAVAGI